MPKKQEIENKITQETAVIKLYKEVLLMVDVDETNTIDKLGPEEKRVFLKFCFDTANNAAFGLLFNDFIYKQTKKVADLSESYDSYMCGKMNILGMNIIREAIIKYAALFEQLYLKDGTNFDPNKAFEPLRNINN